MLCFIRDTGAYFPSLVRRIKRCRTHTSSETLNSSALVNTTSRISNQSENFQREFCSQSNILSETYLHFSFCRVNCFCVESLKLQSQMSAVTPLLLRHPLKITTWILRLGLKLRLHSSEKMMKCQSSVEVLVVLWVQPRLKST